MNLSLIHLAAVSFSLVLLVLTRTELVAQVEPSPSPSCQPNKWIRGYIPPGTRFKIKIDGAVSSNSHRKGDLVQFSVLEDVMGKATADYYKKSVAHTLDAAGNITDPSVKCELIAENGKDYVAIPKDAKGFGEVFSRRGRSAFWIQGKAQIFVLIKEIKFRGGYDDSKEFETARIKFANAMRHENLLPCDPRQRKSRQKLPGRTRNAPKGGYELCIEGRRPSIGFGTAIASPLLAAWLGVAKDDLSYPVAGITLLSEAASGLGDLLNGTTAEVGSGLIFEVETF